MNGRIKRQVIVIQWNEFVTQKEPFSLALSQIGENQLHCVHNLKEGEIYNFYLSFRTYGKKTLKTNDLIFTTYCSTYRVTSDIRNFTDDFIF